MGAVLITGASREIGAACAREFAREGYAVAVHYRQSEAQALALCEELTAAGHEAAAVCADVRDSAAVRRMTALVEERFGFIDVLVNNAGVNIREWATEYDMDKFDFVMNVNLRSYFVASRYAARYMKKQGGGSIVCTSSAMSKEYSSKRCAYHISKTGVNGLVSCLATEWARDNIRVNGIAPGYFATKVTERTRSDPDKSRRVLEHIPANRWGEVQDLMGACVFLASDASRYVNGSMVVVDGGYLVR